MVFRITVRVLFRILKRDIYVHALLFYDVQFVFVTVNDLNLNAIRTRLYRGGPPYDVLCMRM